MIQIFTEVSTGCGFHNSEYLLKSSYIEFPWVLLAALLPKWLSNKWFFVSIASNFLSNNSQSFWNKSCAQKWAWLLTGSICCYHFFDSFTGFTLLHEIEYLHNRSLKIVACLFINFAYCMAGFHLIVCGLDSIVARRWINGMVVCIVLDIIHL